MILKEYNKPVRTKLTKSGFTNLKCVVRKCDNCGNIDEDISVYRIKSSRTKRNALTDLCEKCSYLSKYRKKISSGSSHGNYKHGLSSHGYRRITINGKREYEHKCIIETSIGRTLKGEESIHHIDFNKANNDLKNLCLFDSENLHQICHASAITIGYSLLEKFIWFDSKNKQYTLVKCDKQKFSKKEKQKVAIEIKKQKGTYIATSNGKNLQKPVKLEMIMLNEYKSDKYGWNTKCLHSFIIEKLIGRAMYRNECVHHINGNELDNNMDNLCIMLTKQHYEAHNSLFRCVGELFEKNLIKFDTVKKVYYV